VRGRKVAKGGGSKGNVRREGADGGSIVKVRAGRGQNRGGEGC